MLDDVIAIVRCPDWPDERVAEVANRFPAGATAVQLVEAAEAGVIPKGDAIWLLIRGGLTGAQLQAFGYDLVTRAVAAAYAALTAAEASFGEIRVRDLDGVRLSVPAMPPVHGLCDSALCNELFAIGSVLRITAKLLARMRVPQELAWRVLRAGRVVSMVAQMFESDFSLDRRVAYADQASGVAYRCAPDARVEKEAQFACIKALVSL